MSDTTYQGWSNYETWNAKLWIDNDQGSQEWATELVKAQRDDWKAADALKAELYDAMPDLGATMFADLLQAAFDNINFREIVESIREDMDDDESADEGTDED